MSIAILVLKVLNVRVALIIFKLKPAIGVKQILQSKEIFRATNLLNVT
jgi:hypothetical protein